MDKPLHPTLTGYAKPLGPDKRDYRMSQEMVRNAAVRTSRYWIPGPVLDQWDKPHCVAFSGSAYLQAAPLKQKLHVKEAALYAHLQTIDEWAGEDYDGTSCHALGKWLRSEGYAKSIEWGRNIEELHAHLVWRGPAILGIEWFWDFFTPGRGGYIRRGGGSAGGHAILAIGCNKLRRDPVTGDVGAVRLRNSWGTGWGDSGSCWISYNTLATLIEDDGEVLMPVEVRRAI